MRNAALVALYDDSLKTHKQVESAEVTISKKPDDLNTRAQLVHYYYNKEVTSGDKNISEGRSRHIAWFINNLPDLKFCGTAPFYVGSDDDQFPIIERMWLNTTKNSPETMRRINACMYVGNASKPDGLKLLNSLFPSNFQNIWVMALRDLFLDSRSCFLPTIDSERSKPSSIDDDCRCNMQAQIKSKRHWNSEALASNEIAYGDSIDFTDALFDSTVDLSTVAKAAGSSVFRFQLSNILRFDPEILSLRFKIASLVIRYLPSSKLAVDPIFMGPFDSPRSYDIFDEHQSYRLLECLFDYIAVHWSNQLREFPAEREIAKNAAKFASEISSFFPDSAQIIVSQLSKSAIGKSILKTKHDDLSGEL